jgi:hypothetical protein
MKVAIEALFTFLGALLFLYLFWKRLKDDYSSYQIFSAGWCVLIGGAFMYMVSKFFGANYSFVMAETGSFLGVLIGARRFNMSLIESFEGWVIGGLGFLVMFYLMGVLVSFSPVTALNLTVVLMLAWLFFYVNSRYKRYVWYRSGRVGFSGLLVSGFYFTFRSSNLLVSAIIGREFNWEAIVSVLAAIVSFFALFNFSKKDA